MITHFIVKATVHDIADRENFDRWYGEEHLPQAVAAFRPLRAWRAWSTVEPVVHYACYEFQDEAEVTAMLESDKFKEMVDETTQVWGGKVSRQRDTATIVQLLYAEQKN